MKLDTSRLALASLTPTLRRFLIAIGKNRWGHEPGNRIAAAQKLKKLGLVHWVFTPYGPGAHSGTNRPELTEEGQKVFEQLTKKSNPALEPDLVPILQEIVSKGRVRFHQKHYPLLHAGLIEYASTQRRRFAYVQATDEGLRMSNPKTQEPICLPGVGTQANDYLLDLTTEIITTEAASQRRSSQMLKAHREGKEGCEICGKGLATCVPVLDEKGNQIASIGPECAKKIRKLLEYESNPSISKLKREVSR